MLPIEFFARRAFTVSDTVMLLVGFAMFGAIYWGALYLQNIQGYSALQAGVRTLPWTMMILFVAPIAGRLNARIGARYLATVGMALLSGGMFGLTQLQSDSPYSQIWPFFMLAGIGTALAMPTLSATAMGAIPSEKAGVASGVLNTARQVGGALGIAVLAAVATGRINARWSELISSVPPALHGPATRLGPLVDGGQLAAIHRLAGPTARAWASDAFMSGFRAANWTSAALCVLAAVVAWFGLMQRRPRTQAEPVSA